MSFGVEDWKFIATVGGYLILAATNIMLWISQRDKVNADNLREVQDKTEFRLDNHASRIKWLEACAEKSPSHKDLAELYNAINALASKVDKQSGLMDALKSALNRVEQYLLNNSGGK